MEKQEQKDLSGEGLAWAPAIQHPLDRMYLKKIEGIPLLPGIMGWVVDRQREETEALLAGDGLLVTETSCPDAWGPFVDACKALDLDPSNFQFFVECEGSINAYTTGSEVPIIVATSGLVNAFSPKELTFVIGHELGHYICGHCRCYALTRFLTDATVRTSRYFGEMAQFATIIATSGIRPLLMSWSRYSELSADRAGLLACRDFEAGCAAFLKMGGFPHWKKLPGSCNETLKGQCVAYARNTGRFNILRRLWRELKYSFGATHPRVVERFSALDEWRDMGCYDELADASPEESIRIANVIGNDYLRNELNLLLIETAADYLIENNLADRKTVLSLLRKAFLHRNSLRGTPLEQFVYAELSISKNTENKLTYSLSILLFDGTDHARKVVLPVDYTPDWDFAPNAIRNKFIESRQKELKILVYQPNA